MAQILNKPIVISQYPPENTNVLWATGNISNSKNIDLSSIREFINGEWVSAVQESVNPAIDIINKLPTGISDIINKDPSIYAMFMKGQVDFTDISKLDLAYTINPLYKTLKYIGKSAVETANYVVSYIYRNDGWINHPTTISLTREEGTTLEDVFILIIDYMGTSCTSGLIYPSWDVVKAGVPLTDEEVSELKATWDDINA